MTRFVGVGLVCFWDCGVLVNCDCVECRSGGLCLRLVFWFGCCFTLVVCLECGGYRFGGLGGFLGFGLDVV